MSDACLHCEYFARDDQDSAGYADCRCINSPLLRTRDYGPICQHFVPYVVPPKEPLT